MRAALPEGPCREPAISHHPFLSGAFAPLPFEADANDLPIRGEIPQSLSGTLYRNSPNPQFAPRDDRYHWFLGDGMVHAFHIEKGRVSYCNRWVRTPKFQAERAAHRALYGSWGNPATTDPSVHGKDGGVANTSIVIHGGKVFANEEAHMPFAIAPDTLASEGYWNFAGKLTTGRFTAHPKIDPVTGEMIFFGYSIGGLFTKTIAYGTIDKSGVLTQIESFEAPYSAMVHDFLVTRNYILFPILPLTGSIERARRGAPAFAWEPEKGGHVGIVRRDAPASTMRWFEVDPRHVYHGMNAYEDGDRIIAHVMEYEAPPLFGDVNGKPFDPAKTVSRLQEWSFDLSASSNAFKRRRSTSSSPIFPGSMSVSRSAAIATAISRPSARPPTSPASICSRTAILRPGGRRRLVCPRATLSRSRFSSRAMQRQTNATVICSPRSIAATSGAAISRSSMRPLSRKAPSALPSLRITCRSVFMEIGTARRNAPPQEA